MSLPTKFITTHTIVAKLYQDLGIQEELPIVDIAEWIYDIIEDLKLPIVLIPRVYNNNGENFTNYQMKLPDDYYSLKWAIVDGCPATIAEGDGIHLLGNTCYTESPTVQWGIVSSSPWFVDGFGNQFGPVSGDRSYLSSCSVEFTINENYIKFNQQEGACILMYNALPSDDEGYPLIPDIKEIKDAVVKYVTMKLDYISWRKDPRDQGKLALFNNSKQDYFWHIGKAQTKIKMPDLHEMEKIKREHLRIIPNYNRYKRLFNLYGHNKYNV